MVGKDFHHAPCGFPIVTEKRSSSSFTLSAFELDESVDIILADNAGTNTSSNGTPPATVDDQNASFPGGIRNGLAGCTFRKKIVIRNHALLDGKEGMYSNHNEMDNSNTDEEILGEPMSLTAMATDCEQDFVAMMTIRYHDIVERKYDKIATEHDVENAEQEQDHTEDGDSEDVKIENDIVGDGDGKRMKVLITTTVTTVADVYIRILLASADTNQSIDARTQHHEITLSATTTVEEIDESLLTETDTNSMYPSNVFNFYRDQYRYNLSDVQPQITFSSSAKYLACIIPRPMFIRSHKRINDDNELSDIDMESENGSISSMVYIKPARLSALTIFHLIPPTIEDKDEFCDVNSEGNSVGDVWNELPQPTYLQADELYNEEQQVDGIDNGSRYSIQSSQLLPPIATNPQSATLDPLKLSGDDIMIYLARLLSQITCICDLNHKLVGTGDGPSSDIHKSYSNDSIQNAPLLLVGCTDGSILMVSYKKAIVLGMLYYGNDRGNVRARPISAVNQTVSLRDHAPPRHPKSASASNNISTWDDRSTGLQVLKYHVNEEIGQDRKGVIRGKVLGVQRDGQVIMFSTSFRSDSYNRGVEIQDERTLADYNNILIWESKKSGFTMSAKSMKGFHANSTTSFLNTKRYANAIFIDSNTFATVVRPLYCNRGQGRVIKFDEIFAQVWSVNDARGGGAKLISELSLNYDKLKENQHGSFGNHKISSSRLLSSNKMQFPTSIEYSPKTGCILLSSAIPVRRSTKTTSIEARAFVSLWDWKSSTIGLTLASTQSINFHTKQSRSLGANPTFFGDQNPVSIQRINEEAGTISLVHTFYNGDFYDIDNYRLGILSPAKCRRRHRSLDGQNPIFLSNDYVMYPSLLQPTVGKEIQVEWKRSMVPQSYATQNGPITLATICGKFGRSLALFGSKGLCILDIRRDNDLVNKTKRIHRNPRYLTSCVEGFQCEINHFQFKNNLDRWRMFQRRDEQSFTVTAMLWWENFCDSNEDVLICAVTYTGKLFPCHFLVAWSSRRLEMGEFQLIGDATSNLGHTFKENKGLRLPQGFMPETMSILVQEADTQSDRAVLSIAGTLHGNPHHSIVQLQVNEGDDDARIRRILSHQVLFGAIPQVSSCTDHIFLASCSYNFDLKAANVVQTSAIATLGIVHNHGVCLSAVVFETEGKKHFSKIVDLHNRPTNENRIIQVWLNDFAPSYRSDSCTGTWSWSFMKSNGTLFSWALGDDLLSPNTENSRFALHRRVPLEAINSQDDTCIRPDVFGIKSNERRSLKGSITDEWTIILGSLPSADHRHLLYSGQAPSLGFRSERSLSKSSLYGVSNFDIGIPSSTGSTLLALSMITECYLSQRTQIAEHMAIQIMGNIRNMSNSETTFAELRSIICFLTELVSRKERRNAVDEIERKKFLKATQAVLVRIGISSLIQVQFISLFLNVGRQLEPHHFKSLFPLSLSVDTKHPERVLSLRDLFDMAVDDGSLSIPGAALPLFTNKKIVHSLCINLLHHCINNILDMNDKNLVNVKSFREECVSVHQLYSYITKVEDSERLLHSSLLSTSYDAAERSSLHIDEGSVYNVDGSIAYEEPSSEEFSFIDDDAGLQYDVEISKNQNTKPQGRISALASRLMRPLISSRESRSENAIADAASTFILSNYNESIPITSLKRQDSSSFLSESESASDSSISTVDERDITAYFENEEFASFSASGVVGMSIVSSIFLRSEVDTEVLICALRSVAGLCLVLRSNDIQPSTITTPDNWGLVKDVVENLGVEDFLDAMHTLEGMSSSENQNLVEMEPEESASMATVFLEVLLVQGSTEWDTESAEAICAVISNILTRHEHSPEIVMLSPLLSMILTVACHVANKDLPFGDSDDSDLCALAELYHIVVDGSDL